MRNTTTNSRSLKGRNSSAPLPGDEDGDEIPEAPGGEWDDVLPPDGEIRVALSEITQPGNAREFIGSFDRQQIGEDLAAFIGTNYGGGTYAWKLRSAKNKWLTSREVGGRPVSGTMKISERSYPRKTVAAAAAAAAADPGAGSMTMAQMFQMMQDREARAFDLFMKAAEIRATPPAAAPGLGLADLIAMMRTMREMMPPTPPAASLGETINQIAALRQAFPDMGGGGGGGGGEDDEDGEGGGGIGQLIGIVKGVLQSQTAAPVAAAPVAENPGAAVAPVAKKETGMFEAKVMHALKVLPIMAAEGLAAPDAVDKLLYTWSAQDLDALAQNIDKLTADKVRPYLPDFEKHEVWYRAFFAALKAETVEDAEK